MFDCVVFVHDELVRRRSHTNYHNNEYKLPRRIRSYSNTEPPQVEITIAIFLHVHGYLDKAIGMAGKVISRLELPAQQELAKDERLKKRLLKLFAHLVRGDSYKYHSGAYFARPAADDYSILFEMAPRTFGAHVGRGFSLHKLDEIDKLFLAIDVLPCGIHFATDMIAPVPENLKKTEDDDWKLTSEMFRLKYEKGLRPWRVFARVVCAALKFLGKSETGREMLEKRKRVATLAVDKRGELEKERRNMAARILNGLNKFSPNEQLAVWGPTERRMCHVTPYRRGWLEQGEAEVSEKTDLGMVARSAEATGLSGCYRKFGPETVVEEPRGRFQGTEPSSAQERAEGETNKRASRGATPRLGGRGGGTSSSRSPVRRVPTPGRTRGRSTSQSPSRAGSGGQRSCAPGVPAGAVGAADGRPTVGKTGENPEIHMPNFDGGQDFITTGFNQPTPIRRRGVKGNG